MKNKIVSLSKNEDFKSILSGNKISNKYLTIFFKKLSDKNTNKLNISFVTKRKIGKAVIRNKIKRRLKKHGWRSRMSTKKRQKVLKARRKKGRRRLAV